MTVAELLSKCSSSEITEWRAYYAILAAEREVQKGHR